MTGAKEYQDFVVQKLKHIFGEEAVEEEWDVAKGSMDDYSRELYCPRIDVALRPFNTSRDIENDNKIIRIAIKTHKKFIETLVRNSETPVGSVKEFLTYTNKNPRCFMAIEIEKSGTRKHLLGDIANASIIGAIGVVIPLDDSRLNGFKAIRKYLNFATSVRKLEGRLFKNVLIISQDKFTHIISRQRN